MKLKRNVSNTHTSNFAKQLNRLATNSKHGGIEMPTYGSTRAKQNLKEIGKEFHISELSKEKSNIITDEENF